MIDMHSHILPNIDDGSKKIEYTLKLLEEAQNVGFDAVVTTPHYIEGHYETDNTEKEVLLNAIYQELQNKNINIKLFMGNEIFLTENIIRLLEDDKASTINNTNYVLFEMALNAEQHNLYDFIYELMQYKLVPILAHPERYTCIQKKPELIYDLIQNGVLMQCNYASIIGYYGEKAQIIVKKMLENNMVHFLGSDVHRPNTIYPRIPKIINRLEQIIGEKKLYDLTTGNPKLVLRNKKIDILEPNKIKLTLKEKLIIQFKKKR